MEMGTDDGDEYFCSLKVHRLMLDASEVFLMTFMILQDSYMEPTRVGSDTRERGFLYVSRLLYSSHEQSCIGTRSCMNSRFLIMPQPGPQKSRIVYPYLASADDILSTNLVEDGNNTHCVVPVHLRCDNSDGNVGTTSQRAAF